MYICIVGTGYVGLVTGACFSELGMNVICVDNDSAKIEGLKRFEMPIYEPGLEEVVRRNCAAGRLDFSTDLKSAIARSLVIFIAVGTPPKDDGSVDLSYVDQVAKTIAENMEEYKVVVNKSTVPVGTAERVRDIIQKNLKVDIGFDVVSNPEFLREGSAIEDFMRPNRVVLGVGNEQSKAIMKELYRPLYLLETPVLVTGIRTAELIKYAANAFLATKITFINEVANLCETVGANVSDVAKGIGLDQRIGSKFLHAGPGFGGSCFPKDTLGLAHIAKTNGYEFQIVETVVKVNKEQRLRMVKKIKDAIGTPHGLTICYLGLSFKPNTDDIRESPAIEIANYLIADGAKLRVFDPVAMENAREALAKGDVTFCKNIIEAATGADAMVIAVEWYQFRSIQFDDVKKVMKQPIVIDMRNAYEPANMNKLGFAYYSVGRPESK